MVEPTHLKNMRKSNWIISPSRGEKANHHLGNDRLLWSSTHSACFKQEIHVPSTEIQIKASCFGGFQSAEVAEKSVA